MVVKKSILSNYVYENYCDFPRNVNGFIWIRENVAATISFEEYNYHINFNFSIYYFHHIIEYEY